MSNTLADLHAALHGLGRAATPDAPPDGNLVEDFARLDLDRGGRVGVPEVVYAAGKTPEQVVAIARRVLDRNGRVLISRLSAEQQAALDGAFATAAPPVAIERRAGCPTALVRRADSVVTPTGGHVGVLSAGTSDVPVADEARLMAEEMGCRVSAIYDVGVAGLHRLFPPLGRLFEEGVGALIVAAGMDGALPSVVAGLSPVPVIGLPTSVGYGAGGGGLAALLSMLQSCAPGLAVVNIDNGIGAGAMAAKIANGAVQKGR